MWCCAGDQSVGRFQDMDELLLPGLQGGELHLLQHVPFRPLYRLLLLLLVLLLSCEPHALSPSVGTAQKGFGEQAEELRAAFNAEELAYQRKLEQEEIDEQKQKAAASINADIAHRIPDLSDSTYEPAVIAHHMCLLEERVRGDLTLGTSCTQVS